jgi:hypothetical protein
MATTLVDRSLCCLAPVVVGKRASTDRLDPDDIFDVCAGCGKECDAAEFVRDDEDGSLTDPETGQRFEEGEAREFPEGPDPDEAFDRMVDNDIERRRLGE